MKIGAKIALLALLATSLSGCIPVMIAAYAWREHDYDQKREECLKQDAKLSTDAAKDYCAKLLADD